ncbi:sensor domain-containing diguanylate cyclase [Ornithinibacillus halophilus]|uniref:Diguanylate cyclase with GAF sensor n=1 Tax=Ornithinibacillus halophilus TaxID=930117 RepID=A0A1M5EK25_9BACI|nr:sensor domain-containing diguanylate cyclase [Ornithinibacillus halophilus]SHF79526.1 diguanylate cyclase with GAF sensor [Ornithinibacillus halophilus]
MEELSTMIKIKYYELMTNVNTFNSNEKFYSGLVKLLLDVVPCKTIGLYRYQTGSNYFTLETATGDVDTTSLLRSIIDKQSFYTMTINNSHVQFPVNQCDVLQIEDNEIHPLIIPLQPKKGAIGFLCFLFNNNVKTPPVNIMKVIKIETERVIYSTYDRYRMETTIEKNRFLYELVLKFASARDNNEILTEIIKSIRRVYPDFSYYLLLSQDYDADPRLPVKLLEFSDDDTKRVSTEAFISGELQIENRYNEQNTSLFAPLTGEQGVYGVLEIITPVVMEFSDDEIAFIENFVQAAGKAIERTTLYQESKHLVKDLKLINDTSHQLNSNLQLTEITHLVKNKVIDACQPSEIAFLYSSGNKEAGIDFLSGTTDFFNTRDGRNLGVDLFEKTLETRESTFSGEFTWENPVAYKSVMVIPMEHAEIIHGVVIILHEKTYAFSFNSYKLLQSLIRHSTLAVLNTILKEQLERAVSTDYLTQLFSRNYLDEQIRKHMNSGEMGTLILFDIDDFKIVNDTHGHYVGDEVIKQVANIILMNINDADVGARWGGEELAVYLPDSDINAGVNLAGVIRKQIESFTEPAVTVSAGVSTWKSVDNDTAKDFFIRADKALYDAKSFGKNCVFKIAYGEKAEMQQF